MTHNLKTWPVYFQLQKSGIKTFELRKFDRDYKVGDKFISMEFDPLTNKFTGNEIEFMIVYILKDANIFGLQDGYCIIQLLK